MYPPASMLGETFLIPSGIGTASAMAESVASADISGTLRATPSPHHQTARGRGWSGDSLEHNQHLGGFREGKTEKVQDAHQPLDRSSERVTAHGTLGG